MHNLFCIAWTLTFGLVSPGKRSANLYAPPRSESYPGSNLTYQEIFDLLDKNGYEVIESANEPPLALVGDIAYTAEQVLPELAPPKERGETKALKTHLWLDSTGKAEVFYFYDTKTSPNRKLFEQAVETWSKSTCIRFIKMAEGTCNRKATHGAVCVGNNNGCWSMVGNMFGLTKANQKMSVGEGCELYAAAHEFGHALGLHHEMARSDRDSFIVVNYENFEVERKSKKETEKLLRSKWSQGAKCKDGQGFQSSAPLPYDYMSLMQYGESDFADTDYRMIFVTKNAHYQYMFDYKRSGGYLQTHYDFLLMNLIYKCSEKWRASCTKSGKSPPKCRNNGYLKKDCTCACPSGFSGASCEKKHGRLFPVKDRAKAMMYINKPGRYRLKGRGMHTNNKNYPLSRFIYYQYATIVIKGKDKKTMTSVRVFEPGDVSQSYTMKVARLASYFTKLDKHDCEFGMLFYWGRSAKGRMRTECFSTFVNNEPKENALVLRGRDYTLDIVIIAKIGEMFPYAEFTKWMLEILEFRVSFPRRPQSGLKLLQSKFVPPVFSGASTEQGVLGNDSAAALIGKVTATVGGRAAAIGGSVGLLLLLGGIAAGVIFWRRKKARESEGVGGRIGEAFADTFLDSSDSDSAQSADSGGTGDGD